MADFKPVISAIIGLGGYGETHLDLFNRDVEKGTHAAKLAYAMDVAFLFARRSVINSETKALDSLNPTMNC